jgi:DNA adenine methylase
MAMSREPEFYYELRATDPSWLKPLDRAARFIYLNRFCFNGVYRTNKAGKFNVPRGSGKLSVPTYETVREFAKKLKQADLCCADFETLVRRATRGDFLYLDPPYALGEKRDRGEYGAGAFRESDELRLVHSLKAASARGAKVLLSYSPSPSIRSELVGWNFHELSVARSVAGFAGQRRNADEILVSNYEWDVTTSSDRF